MLGLRSGNWADFAVTDLDSDGKDEMIVAGVSSKGTLFTSGRSSIMAYELEVPEAAKQKVDALP